MTPQEIAEQTRDMALERKQAVERAVTLALNYALHSELAHAAGHPAEYEAEAEKSNDAYEGLIRLVTELAAKAYS